jgi:glucokinase
MTHFGFKPIDKLDDVRVVEALEHRQLVEDHTFVAPDILLQNDFDSNPARWAVCLSNNAIGACAQRAPEAVLGPGAGLVSTTLYQRERWRYRYTLLLVALGLPM